MDANKSSQEQSSSDRIDNTLWLAVLHWGLKKVLQALDVEECLTSTTYIIPDVGNYSLRVKRLSLTDFEIELCRETEDSIKWDPDCHLEVCISVLGFKAPIKMNMIHGMDRVSTIFQYSKHENMQNITNFFVKCILKLREVSVLKNEASREQNKLIEVIIARENKNRIADLAFLLQTESFDKIFTGRQTMEFALTKIGLIERTLKYASEIANKVRAQQNNIKYETETPPNVYLAYIFNSSKSISKAEAGKFYLQAHMHDLPYLANECRDFMLLKACKDDDEEVNSETLATLLYYSDCTHDLELAYKGLNIFMRRKAKVMETLAWKNALKDDVLFPAIQSGLDAGRQFFMAEVNRQLVPSEEKSVEGHNAVEFIRKMFWRVILNEEDPNIKEDPNPEQDLEEESDISKQEESVE